MKQSDRESRGSYGSEVPVGVRIVTDVLVRHVPPLQQVLVPLILQKTHHLVSHGMQVSTFRGAQAHTVFIVVECLHRHTGPPLTCQSSAALKQQTNSYLSELHHHFCALSSHRLHRRNQNQWTTHESLLYSCVSDNRWSTHIYEGMWNHFTWSCQSVFPALGIIRPNIIIFIYIFSFTSIKKFQYPINHTIRVILHRLNPAESRTITFSIALNRFLRKARCFDVRRALFVWMWCS